jgi:hypothetical protein
MGPCEFERRHRLADGTGKRCRGDLLRGLHKGSEVENPPRLRPPHTLPQRRVGGAASGGELEPERVEQPLRLLSPRQNAAGESGAAPGAEHRLDRIGERGGAGSESKKGFCPGMAVGGGQRHAPRKQGALGAILGCVLDCHLVARPGEAGP